MFLDFYHLREQPFGVTPDPKYLYLSPTHREALASLLYGIRSGRGFMTLIAPPGMGKTTLLFCLLQRLKNSSRTAFMFQTQCTSKELLRQLLADLRIESSADDVVEMHQQLNKFLISEAENGRRVVVFIDEAQNLSDEVLESVRLLSNFETASSKLIHVILAGQPPLADKLARPSMAQLRQRIAIMAHLDPFAPADTDQYIHHRLWASGHSGKNEPFNVEARALIAEFSEGIPRNINNLCFNAMSLGFAQQERMIDGAIVREVMADSDITSLGSEQSAPSNPFPVDPPAPLKPAPQTRRGASRRTPIMADEESQLEWSPPTVPDRAERPAAPEPSSSSWSTPRPVSFPTSLGSERAASSKPRPIDPPARLGPLLPSDRDNSQPALARPSAPASAKTSVTSQSEHALQALQLEVREQASFDVRPFKSRPDSLMAEKYSWRRRVRQVAVVIALLAIFYYWFAIRSSAMENWSDSPSAVAPSANIQDLVRLEAVVSKGGTIQRKVRSGRPMLAKATQQAVQSRRFRPTLLNGEPVESMTGLTVNSASRGVQ